MADIASSATTARVTQHSGHQRTYQIDYSTAGGLTTAAAADTVATPLRVVNEVSAFWLSSAAVAANTLACAVSTGSPGNVIIAHSTHDSLAIRIIARGR